MEILAERGMARKSGGAWRAITPGRMTPSLRRAVTLLLSRRADLPPALATELDAWNRTLEAPDPSDAPPPSQAVTEPHRAFPP